MSLKNLSAWFFFSFDCSTHSPWHRFDRLHQIIYFCLVSMSESRVLLQHIPKILTGSFRFWTRSFSLSRSSADLVFGAHNVCWTSTWPTESTPDQNRVNLDPSDHMSWFHQSPVLILVLVLVLILILILIRELSVDSTIWFHRMFKWSLEVDGSPRPLQVLIMCWTVLNPILVVLAISLETEAARWCRVSSHNAGKKGHSVSLNCPQVWMVCFIFSPSVVNTLSVSVWWILIHIDQISDCRVQLSRSRLIRFFLRFSVADWTFARSCFLIQYL